MRAVRIALVVFAAVSAFGGDDRLVVRRTNDPTVTDIARQKAGDTRRHLIRFTLVEPEAGEPLTAVTVMIRDVGTSAVGLISLEGRMASRPHTLRAPRGSYELTFEAPHHRTIHRRIDVAETDVNLGRLAFVRYPVLSGRVRGTDGSPIGGAVIEGGADLFAKSDALGAFQLEVRAEWPSQVAVSFPGLATKAVAVPPAQRSATLPPVTLSKASRIALVFEWIEQDVDVDLARESGYKRWNTIRTQHVTAAFPRTAFEDIPGGDYVAIVRGAAPLQRLPIALRTKEGESVESTVRLEPIDVLIEVRRGSSPVAGALVTVQSDGNRWASTVRTDTEGRFNAQAWERGDFVFAVQANETSVPAILLHSIDGTGQATVRLELPDRTIAGRVIDSDGGKAVQGASVLVESTNDDSTAGTLGAITDADGKFLLEGLRDGSHTLVAQAESYVVSEPQTLRVDQSSPRGELTVSISRGIARQVRVTNAGGVPARRAVVVASSSRAVVGVWTTDEIGRATLRLPPGRPVVLFVLPAEGSLAIVRSDGKPSDREELIIVPDGNASVEIRTIDADGRPVPNVYFAMRYDGEVIPPDVAQVLEMRGGLRPISRADGVARLDHLPTGFLELWPIRTRQEFEQLLASGAPAPVQVALRQGANVATLTFVKKH